MTDTRTSSHGRVVHYVHERNGECRPAFGVKRHAEDHTTANLIVFTDGDDDDLHPVVHRKAVAHVKPRKAEPERVAQTESAEAPRVAVREPGTWHWPSDCEG
jgi:hypothetical protein